MSFARLLKGNTIENTVYYLHFKDKMSLFLSKMSQIMSLIMSLMYIIFPFLSFICPYLCSYVKKNEVEINSTSLLSLLHGYFFLNGPRVRRRQPVFACRTGYAKSNARDVE